MIKRTITYRDYDDDEQTEEFYFKVTDADDNKKTIAPPFLTLNEIRQLAGLEPIYDSGLANTHITNCKNCGAVLTRNKYCEYCGTHY